MTPNFRCSIHVLAGDATKHFSNERKYQTLRIRARYWFGLGREVISHEVWPDVGQVTGGTGMDCCNMMRKQCRIVNCPVLDSDVYEPFMVSVHSQVLGRDGRQRS